jgi:putative membrane protein
MKKLLSTFAAAGLLAGFATAAYALTPSAFVEKAGASDMFEVDSAKQMIDSKNPAIAHFAHEMIKAHTESTQMVMAAVHADHLSIKKPELSIAQRADLTALKAVPGGKSKDDLYVKQQVAAHKDAHDLMLGYSSTGGAPHLKAAAAKILPVVEMHQGMLGKL